MSGSPEFRTSSVMLLTATLLTGGMAAALLLPLLKQHYLRPEKPDPLTQADAYELLKKRGQFSEFYPARSISFQHGNNDLQQTLPAPVAMRSTARSNMEAASPLPPAFAQPAPPLRTDENQRDDFALIPSAQNTAFTGQTGHPDHTATGNVASHALSSGETSAGHLPTVPVISEAQPFEPLPEGNPYASQQATATRSFAAEQPAVPTDERTNRLLFAHGEQPDHASDLPESGLPATTDDVPEFVPSESVPPTVVSTPNETTLPPARSQARPDITPSVSATTNGAPLSPKPQSTSHRPESPVAMSELSTHATQTQIIPGVVARSSAEANPRLAAQQPYDSRLAPPAIPQPAVVARQPYHAVHPGSVYAPITVNVDNGSMAQQIQNLESKIEQLVADRQRPANREDRSRRRERTAENRHQPDGRVAERTNIETALQQELNLLEREIRELNLAIRTLQTQTDIRLEQLTNQANKANVANQVIEAYQRALETAQTRRDATRTQIVLRQQSASADLPESPSHASASPVPTPPAMNKFQSGNPRQDTEQKASDLPRENDTPPEAVTGQPSPIVPPEKTAELVSPPQAAVQQPASASVKPAPVPPVPLFSAASDHASGQWRLADTDAHQTQTGPLSQETVRPRLQPVPASQATDTDSTQHSQQHPQTADSQLPDAGRLKQRLEELRKPVGFQQVYRFDMETHDTPLPPTSPQSPTASSVCQVCGKVHSADGNHQHATQHSYQQPQHRAAGQQHSAGRATRVAPTEPMPDRAQTGARGSNRHVRRSAGQPPVSAGRDDGKKEPAKFLHRLGSAIRKWNSPLVN